LKLHKVREFLARMSGLRFIYFSLDMVQSRLANLYQLPAITKYNTERMVINLLRITQGRPKPIQTTYT